MDPGHVSSMVNLGVVLGNNNDYNEVRSGANGTVGGRAVMECNALCVCLAVLQAITNID